MVDLVPTYIAHRLAANLQSAARWVAWLSRRYTIEPVCPWIVLASQWDESDRALGLEIDLVAIRRVRAFVATGPEWSSGVRTEADEFMRFTCGKLPVSLVGFDGPTDLTDGELSALDAEMARRGIVRRHA